MQSNNNILIAQGGGPTNVINQSLVSIINGEKNKNSNILNFISNSKIHEIKKNLPRFR